jgi:hypothetical protein
VPLNKENKNKYGGLEQRIRAKIVFFITLSLLGRKMAFNEMCYMMTACPNPLSPET